jgi:hypothetical protein
MGNNRPHFQPMLPDAQGKHNSRLLIRIERDGTSLSLVRLHVVAQRDREEIILIHFLKKYLPLMYQRDCGVNILSRDAPWDFALEIQGGENFNVEITSIADNKNLFELESAERELSSAKTNKQLPPHKIQKLDKLFPRDQGEDLSRAENPYFEKQMITVSPLQSATESYESLLLAAISAKANKRHGGKEETILVIDDQTTAFTSDEILSCLVNFESPNPFKEIWIYVGYWGSLSGDGEYTLIRFLPVALQGDDLRDN